MNKVLIIANHINGVYNFRRELVDVLLSMNYEVYISAPKGEQTSYFENKGCILEDLKINSTGINPFEDFLLLRNLVRSIKRIRPHVVLTYTIKPNLYGGIACRLLKVKSIANITGLGSAVENPGLLQIITIPLYRFALKKTSLVFFQNRANLDFLIDKNVVKQNYKLIPGSGVNLSFHSVSQYPVDDKIVFLYVGRLIKEKGIDLFIETAKYIKTKYDNVEFHIVGKCDENYAEIVKGFTEQGVIVYKGRTNDVRPYYHECHCLIHPSYYPEGMSNVLLEACAAGRPIITTDRPGCREIVDNDINGFVVRQQDVQDLISKVEKFIALPYEKKVQMGQQARIKVENEFNRQIVIDAYLKEIV